MTLAGSARAGKLCWWLSEYASARSMTMRGSACCGSSAEHRYRASRVMLAATIHAIQVLELAGGHTSRRGGPDHRRRHLRRAVQYRRLHRAHRRTRLVPGTGRAVVGSRTHPPAARPMTADCAPGHLAPAITTSAATAQTIADANPRPVPGLRRVHQVADDCSAVKKSPRARAIRPGALSVGI